MKCTYIYIHPSYIITHYIAHSRTQNVSASYSTVRHVYLYYLRARRTRAVDGSSTASKLHHILSLGNKSPRASIFRLKHKYSYVRARACVCIYANAIAHYDGQALSLYGHSPLISNFLLWITRDAWCYRAITFVFLFIAG